MKRAGNILCGTISLACVCLWPLSALTEDIVKLGGDLSIPRTGPPAIQAPAPNLTDQERLLEQVLGFPVFHRILNEDTGLGPKFINASCNGCHVQNGKGRVQFKRSLKRLNSMVSR